MREYNRNLKHLSRRLRKNMTEAEVLFWSRVSRKQLGVPFYRQKPLGNYIVDFYCPASGLIVELDGDQHYTDEGRKKDIERDAYLRFAGLHTMRFYNHEVLGDIEWVIDRVVDYIRGGEDSF